MPMFFRVIGSICLLAFAAQATAQQGPKAQQIFGSILGGYYDDASDLDLRKGGDGIGGAIGIGFTDNLAIELSYLEFKPGVKVDSVRGDGDLGLTSLNMLYSIGNGQSWQPYLTFGGGHGKFKYDGLQGNKNEPIVNVGAGFFTNLTPRVAFRTDVRGLYHTGAGSVSPMATVGLTFMIGGAKPAPVVMAAAPVDSDGDGVTDDRDACPNTPAGVSVDSRGCPLDSDGDGVPDYKDDCPNTPAGAKVNDRGCEIVIEKPVSFNLTVEFAFDSAEITGVAFQEMLDLLKFLREYPSTNAVIEGHSDSRGAEDYNLNLSQRRAAAVVQALTNSGIAGSRLSPKGFGESQPIASNDTEAGRQKNRRVTVVVSGVSKGN